MKRVLDLRFIKTDSKKITIQIDDAKENPEVSKINALMDFVVSKNLFSFKGIEIAKKDGANTVVTDSQIVNLA